MSVKSEIKWFMDEFGERVQEQIEDTPITLALMAAIAYQETGYLWRRIRSGTTTEEEFLALCVGDTIDAKPNGKGRKAFPKNKAALVAYAEGSQMFSVARQALVDMADVTGLYTGSANKSHKFCRGFGIFQLDLQFFKGDPDYFLNEGWSDFDSCLEKAIEELGRAVQKAGFGSNDILDQMELTTLAIRYNTGGYKASKGLKQGHRNAEGEYYGELVHKYIGIAQGLVGNIVVAKSGGGYTVNARSGLVLRGGPGQSFGRLTALDYGATINVLTYEGNWAQVDLEGDGIADGYVYAYYLIKN